MVSGKSPSIHSNSNWDLIMNEATNVLIMSSSSFCLPCKALPKNWCHQPLGMDSGDFMHAFEARPSWWNWQGPGWTCFLPLCVSDMTSWTKNQITILFTIKINGITGRWRDEPSSSICLQVWTCNGHLLSISEWIPSRANSNDISDNHNNNNDLQLLDSSPTFIRWLLRICVCVLVHCLRRVRKISPHNYP